MKVRFTDDAGLYWEIDPDLHLKRLDARGWSFTPIAVGERSA
jgi:hypothetical protein